MIDLVLFGFFSILIAIGVLLIVFRNNLVHAAYALALVLVGIAGYFVLVGSELLAVVQILLYAGGVVILLAFGIMMTNRLRGDRVYSEEKNRLAGGILAVALFSLLVTVISTVDWNAVTVVNKSNEQVSQIGISFLTEHIIAFELVAFVLLVALVGASYLAKMADE